ncbi:Alpha/Beta hydrolase protein [Mycena amicta]|nr:Alpha/Beta hydrolase protein [Mycena amicta]
MLLSHHPVLHTLVLGTLAGLLRASPAPVVDLGYAKYQGFVDPSTSFLGLRYAASPAGEGRFRAPQPPLLVDGVQPATDQPAQCWQVSVTGLLSTNPFRENASVDGLPITDPFAERSATDVSDEDCLFLSVYYPSNASGAPLKDLPVVVWIHGGGYSSVPPANSIASSPFNGRVPEVRWDFLCMVERLLRQ